VKEGRSLMYLIHPHNQRDKENSTAAIVKDEESEKLLSPIVPSLRMRLFQQAADLASFFSPVSILSM
jgi:hypothetical protein